MNKETSTKIIPDLGEELVADVKAELKKRLESKKPEPDSLYENVPVYKLGDVQNGYYVLLDGDQVIYFLRYREIKHNRFKLGRQVLIWRDKSHPASVGFARFIFFKKLLPNYHALVADQLQTKNGMEFWQYSAKYAFEHGYKVYFLDRRSVPNKLTQFLSYSDIIVHRDALWGTSEGHKRTFLMISDRELTLKSKT